MASRTLAALVLTLLLCPTIARAGETKVRVQDGLISAVFDASPGEVAFAAIRRATGVEIVVPESLRRKILTLTLQPAPFEQFVRALLRALDVGGFALEYERGGAADRLIVADIGRNDGAEPVAPAAAEARGAHGRKPITVPILLSRREVASIKLGEPGQVMLVQSPPYAKVRTTECDGTSGDYPVQSVLIMNPTTTYLTSIIVCNAGGLGAGETLTPEHLPPDVEDTSPHVRFGAASR